MPLMRKALVLLLFSFACVSAFGANDWYANNCNGQNIDGGTCTWNTTSTGSCTASGGTSLTWANRAAGDAFHSNGCASITLDVDPGVSGSPVILTNSSAAQVGGGTGTAGGTFALSSNIAVTASFTGGSAANPVITLTGSPTASLGCATCVWTAGGSSGANAVTDTHTTSVVTATCQTVNGGSANGALGYSFNSASGTVNMACNARGGTTSSATGISTGSTSGTAIFNLTGNCIANDGIAGGFGCNAASTSSGAVVFNINGAIVGAKYISSGFSNGKMYSGTVSYVFIPKSSAYQSTDVVDGTTGALLVSPTLTNVTRLSSVASGASNSGSAQ